jgi:aspartate-semialdehyde dehydrogenase
MDQTIVSLVGGESLLGRELRDMITDRQLPVKLQLIGSDDAVLSEIGGEAVVMTALDEDILRRSRVAFLVGSQAASLRASGMLRNLEQKPVVVDMSYALEDAPEARIRAPQFEAEGTEFPNGTVHIVAHPAAVTLASILGRIHRKFAIRQAVVQIFEPVSELGQAGLTELQQQTASLLSFRSLPKDIFDAQISFNMLPRYGEDAPRRLEEVEQRIERHFAVLAGSDVPMPSMRLVQAPVFHGYSLSIWVEFEENPGPEALAEALASAQIEIRSVDMEPPTNVGSVGQSGATVGIIERDRNNRKALWMWAVADNFQVQVDTALEVAMPYLGARV